MFKRGTMTLAELESLVAESNGEWEHIEFTKTTGEMHGGMDTLYRFLNDSTKDENGQKRALRTTSPRIVRNGAETARA
jgi:hypothetical protein